MVLNLLSNAIKFSTHDKHRGEVWLQASYRPACDDEGNTDDGGVIKLTVTDNGIGMSVQQQAELFKPFTQADDSTTRKFGGTGLGLSITKSCINMMGGKITTDSELGKGSQFTVTIPCKIKSNDGSLKPMPDLQDLAILTIINDQNTSGIIARNIEQMCAQTVHTADTESALSLTVEKIQKTGQSYDLVILQISPEPHEFLREFHNVKEFFSVQERRFYCVGR